MSSKHAGFIRPLVLAALMLGLAVAAPCEAGWIYTEGRAGVHNPDDATDDGVALDAAFGVKYGPFWAYEGAVGMVVTGYEDADSPTGGAGSGSLVYVSGREWDCDILAFPAMVSARLMLPLGGHMRLHADAGVGSYWVIEDCSVTKTLSDLSVLDSDESHSYVTPVAKIGAGMDFELLPFTTIGMQGEYRAVSHRDRSYDLSGYTFQLTLGIDL